MNARHGTTWYLTAAAWLLLVVAMTTTVKAQQAETWVEHLIGDCTGEVEEIRPETLSFASLTQEVVDSDANRGNAAESTDGDAIYHSISQAAASTSSGGIVHIPAAGPYRETSTITITDSVTIRGFEDGDVIVTTDCVASPPSAAFTISIGSGKVVTLENLTIRGFTTAIDATGSTTGSTLILRNVTIEGNTTGISAQGYPEVRIFDSRVSGGTTGISGVLVLSVVDSEVSNNSTASVTSSNATGWRFVRSIVADNGAGISVNGSGSGTGIVEVTDSQVVRNGSDGIAVLNPLAAVTVHESVIGYNDGDGVRIEANTGSGFAITDSLIQGNSEDGIHVKALGGCTSISTDPVQGVVMHSRILGNIDDGIEVEATGTGCPIGQTSSHVRCGLLANTVSMNNDYGLDETTTGPGRFDCDVGHNQISYNTTAAELNTGTSCTGVTTTENQAN